MGNPAVEPGGVLRCATAGATHKACIAQATSAAENVSRHAFQRSITMLTLMIVKSPPKHSGPDCPRYPRIVLARRGGPWKLRHDVGLRCDHGSSPAKSHMSRSEGRARRSAPCADGVADGYRHTPPADGNGSMRRERHCSLAWCLPDLPCVPCRAAGSRRCGARAGAQADPLARHLPVLFHLLPCRGRTAANSRLGIGSAARITGGGRKTCPALDRGGPPVHGRFATRAADARLTSEPSRLA